MVKISNNSNTLQVQTPKIIEGSQMKILSINSNSEINFRKQFLLIQTPTILTILSENVCFKISHLLEFVVLPCNWKSIYMAFTELLNKIRHI